MEYVVLKSTCVRVSCKHGRGYISQQEGTNAMEIHKHSWAGNAEAFQRHETIMKNRQI